VIQIFKYEETQIASAASYPSATPAATVAVLAAIAEVVADGHATTDAKAVVVAVGGIRRGDRGRRTDDVR
jgi:hypothetical protein